LLSFYKLQIWDRRSLREVNPQPCAVMAGHLDGITFIDSKVSLSVSMCACHIYAVLAANVIKFITSMVYISVMSMFLSVVYL